MDTTRNDVQVHKCAPGIIVSEYYINRVSQVSIEWQILSIRIMIYM